VLFSGTSVAAGVPAVNPSRIASCRRASEVADSRMFIVYVYQKCSTCRDALRWLDGQGIPYQVKAIRETPPGVAELREALALLGGDIRKLFNSSGMDYRAMGMKEKLPGMSETGALELLSTHGNLVKRPFLIGGGKALAGFKPELWRKTLTGT
jgi:arsenate reductase